MSTLDIVRLVGAALVGLLWLAVVACNWWYAFRSIVRDDQSSPSPMPVVAAIPAALIALLIPGLPWATRAAVAGLGWGLADGVLAIESAVRAGRTRSGPNGPASTVPSRPPAAPPAASPATDSTQHDLTARLQALLASGIAWDDALTRLRAESDHPLEAMKAVRSIRGGGIHDALALLHQHPAWRERAQRVYDDTNSFFDSLPDACEYDTPEGRRQVVWASPVRSEDCEVRVSDASVLLLRPHDERFEIPWAELRRVVVATSDDGPLEEDVWMRFEGVHAVCAVPQGAVGFEVLLADVQKRLPGFDNEAFISAMSCGENRRFVVWERP